MSDLQTVTATQNVAKLSRIYRQLSDCLMVLNDIEHHHTTTLEAAVNGLDDVVDLVSDMALEEALNIESNCNQGGKYV